MELDHAPELDHSRLMERAYEVAQHLLDGMDDITGHMTEPELAELRMSLVAQAIAHLRACGESS